MQIQQHRSQNTYQHGAFPDQRGRFGEFGGKFVPESLMAPLAELEQAYKEAQRDPAFKNELNELLRIYVGRPTSLYYVPRFSQLVASGVKVYLKREDLAHTGAHKINNALGQGLLARRMGKKTHHRRNRRGPAWRGDSDGLRDARSGLYCLYGR